MVLTVKCLIFLLQYTTEFAPKWAISSEKSQNFPGMGHSLFPKPLPSGEGTPPLHAICKRSLKSTLNWLQFHRWHYGSIFIRVVVVASKIAKSREISTKFDLIAVEGHPRSSILVSIESSHATSYYLLIVTLTVYAIVFEIFTLKDRQESRAAVRKPCDTASVFFPLKFANSIHYKYKTSQALKAATLQSSKHAGAQRNLTQNAGFNVNQSHVFGVSGKTVRQ